MAIKHVAVLSPRWGTTSGGINALNFDLFSNITKHIKSELIKIHCFVLESNDIEKQDSISKGIELYNLDLGNSMLKKDFSPYVKQIADKLNLSFDWVIGHDIMTGLSANMLVSTLRFEKKNIKSAIFHHMNYEAYESLKEEFDIKELSSKILFQKEILNAADLILAVGTKLKKSAEDKVDNPNIEISEFIPGLPEISGKTYPNSFRAVIFGRLDEKNINTKQFLLPIETIAKLQGENKTFGNDAIINLIGIDEADENIAQIISGIKSKYNIPSLSINPMPYIKDRGKLLDFLKGHSVCIVPSIQEGFGMVGWESIAAEVPLVLSENSGLYEFLEESYGGTGTGNIIPVEIHGNVGNSPSKMDIDNMSKRLLRFLKKPEKHKANALRIKEIIQSQYSWEHVSQEFCTTIEVEDITYEPLNIGSLATELNGVESGNTFQNITIRKNLLIQMLDSIKGSSENTDVIIFGGISSALITEKTYNILEHFLGSHSSNSIYFCYESGDAAIHRANLLNSEIIETESGLSSDTIKRMKEKEDKVIYFKNKFQINTNGENWKSRCHFIEIKHPLTAYITINGDDAYLTPLFETRSSETISFSIPKQNKKSRVDVFKYMIYHLTKIEGFNNKNTLVKTLNLKLITLKD